MTDRENAPGAQLHSLEREVSYALIKASGGYAVRVPLGSKKPETDWDPRKITEGISRQILSEMSDSPNCNIGLHVFGKLVDVDVNAEGADKWLVPAMDALMPSCNHVWGRPSRPRTHRLYMIEGADDYSPINHAVLRRIRDIPDIETEGRGGAQGRGEYVLLPGSVHPSDETYSWADLGKAKEPPAVASIGDIMKGLRMSCVVALIARYWRDCNKDVVTHSLAGFMHRVNDLTSSLD